MAKILLAAGTAIALVVAPTVAAAQSAAARFPKSRRPWRRSAAMR
ncbi:hypothetical protein [Allosphingosinicella deserti]|nr:hypothetical protein [Sphingomonas deserti]